MEFLESLAQNNNRTWFNDHKDQYLHARDAVIELAGEVLERLRATDRIETATGEDAMYRIYRDMRFTKDKTPYNVHWSALYKRAGAERRGSYYLRIEPGGKSLAGGGFWGPNRDDLRLIRSHIAQDAEPFREVLADPVFRKTFGEMRGRRLKTAPRDYSIDHPAIDLLRYKQFKAFRSFSDEEVLRPDFADRVAKTFEALRPFFDHMSEILTTDLNGESLID